VEVLQQADVILHDRLVPEEILDRARKDAERIDVGKRAGDHHGVQARIFQLLVEKARAGKTVVRLKGGDAFVFGRGGEELQHLRAHGIDYEVVPGVTAALGCAAYAGIPLTHRELAHRVTFVTGHFSAREQDSFGPSASTRETSTQSTETLVVYMGVKQARKVRRDLMAQDIPGWTPAALIVDGTLDRQRVIHGTVSTLPAMAGQVADGAPGLFIIGTVAALGQDLAWFHSGPALEQAA
jgi:uroporphyrin-III C-methyltransferase/precorrin-2 dehydrogenase/sirohydrochlorin ferrochelatase